MGWTRTSLASLALAAALAACGPSRMQGFVTDDGASDATTTGDAPAGDAPVGPADAQRCARQADCDDRIACTEETCIVGGVCERAANDRLCQAGQRCDLARGCVAMNACATNADCNDGVACTRDVCVAGGTCERIRDDAQCGPTEICSLTRGCVAMGTCGANADCDDRTFCNGEEQCVMGRCQAGTPPTCRDSDPCTADLCSESMRACSHPPVTPCGGTVTPGTYGLAPSPMYSCGAGSFGPITQVTLAVSASGVTVTGFPVALTGAAPTMGMFSATGRESRGGCQWVYTLSGSFTMPNRFQGSWNLSFDFCSAALRCFSQFGEVTGTMR